MLRPSTRNLLAANQLKPVYQLSKRKESSVTIEVGSNPITLRTGHIARFADGAVVSEFGDNAILATIVSKMKPTSNGDGLPLNVSFKQSAAAVGRIPTNYLRRELQQSDSDIIASRIIDRSLRPMFVDGFSFDTQVECKPLAIDETGDGVVLGLNAASAALACSQVPMKASVAAVRVGILDGNIVVNPRMDEMKYSPMNLLMSGTNNERLVMLEMDGKEIRTEIFEESLNKGFHEIEKLIIGIESLKQQAGKEKLQFEMMNVDLKEKIMEQVKNLGDDQLFCILMDPTHDKTSRDVAITNLKKLITTTISESPEYPYNVVDQVFTNYVKDTYRKIVLEHNQRCDGRKLDEFRPISIQVDVYKKLHGSALFQRGQSQVLGTVTFDSPAAAFHPDSIAQLLGAQQKKMFMLHYEFPGFATNEFSARTSFNRRELGHGILAEKSLKHVIPDDFPYCIRLACQVLESNGSTSMASSSVGSLSLYDAGVPIKSPVAGVAIGLLENETNKNDYRILTDIMGFEDYAGDMDFKIAGTKNGFTAMQLDIKNDGLTKQQVKESLNAAKNGILHVLEKMNLIIPEPRTEFKKTVPVMEDVPLPSYKRSCLFKNGGYNAKQIEAETGTKIFIEDEQCIKLFSPNKEKLEKAKKMVEEFSEENATIDLTFGQWYTTEIVEIRENGIFVRIKQGTKPLFIPNHELDIRKVQHASVLGLKEGQQIKIQYFGRDPVTGYHRLSRKITTGSEQKRADLLGKK